MTATTFTNACGHPFNPPRVAITTRRLEEVTNGASPRITSISGGRRVLLAVSCECGQTAYYRQSIIGTDSRTLKNTPQAIASALTEVLAEPTDVFTIDLHTDRALHVVIPRHQLPLFVLETWGES